VSSLRKRPLKARRPVPEPDDADAAELAAVALLARRDFGSAELAARLLERGYEAGLVAQLIASLQERRALDDARFAGHYVSYHAARGQGPARIRRDLDALGVAGALCEEALAAGPDWRALARDVRRRRFGPELPADWAEKGRQARFLQYRGFTNDHIRIALGPDFDPDT
jgi:regulatory protein